MYDMIASLSMLQAALTDLSPLPIYTSYSLLRMTVALLMSYAFAIPYGIVAAHHKTAEKVLMPVLDILQSVPILGFFPAAIFFFVAVFNESWQGVELASIFLIFTSQAWNLAFAVYESVSAIPSDIEEASDSFRLKGLPRFKRLYIPASVPKLVYNGMMSWAGGWYFLVAAEIISLGSKQYTLPGIGRYLAEATYSGNYVGTILGLVSLVSTILVVDLVVWRPLRGYAEQFKYESVSAEGAIHHTLFHASSFAWLRSHMSSFYSRSAEPRTSLAQSTGQEPLAKIVHYVYGEPRRMLERRRKLLGAALASLIILAVLAAGATIVGTLFSFMQGLYEDLQKPAYAPQITLLPSALGSSVFRLILAYLLSVAWTLPLAVMIAGSKKRFGTSMFIVEVLASLPATAIFPLIILATVGLPGGLQITSIILTMTGMQWYLLFNLVAGAKSIPSDLVEASQAYRLRGLDRWRRLIIPVMLPSFITGSITAWGGGWNALVVSEYVVFGKQALSVPGIGATLDRAAYELGSIGLLTASVAVMAITIVSTNRLFWRRLYRFVLSRYRLD